MDLLKAWPQHPLPHHLLSRIVHRAMRSTRFPTLRLAFMRWFVRAYQVAVDEAVETDLAAYPTFNAFFTRALKPGARPIAAEADAIACPADCLVSQAQPIRAGRVFQAKGRGYTATELLGGDPRRAAPFDGGTSATLYLSPRDYHRVHMPVDGDLIEMVHVPGRLFSVNPPTTRAVDRLFARNERVVFILDTVAGRIAYAMVGALFVSSVETVWAGEVTPPAGREVRRWVYRAGQHRFRKGDEIARFNMGSTVVLLTEPGRVAWDAAVQPDAPLRMGQRIGTFRAGS